MVFNEDPWQVSKEDFPRGGSEEEQLKFLLNYAVLAPSSHNSQPWRFKVYSNTVEIYADRSRALPVVDSQDRELTISCGAALFFLRVAIGYFGWASELSTFPEPGLPDLLARLRLGNQRPPSRADVLLFQVMPKRRTTRLPYEHSLPPLALLDTLEAAAKEQGTWLQAIKDNEEKKNIASLIAEGDRLQMADKQFRRELAAWIHPGRGMTHDGIPGYALGMPALLDFATIGLALAVRTFDMGNGVAAKDEKLATGSPLLLVLGTEQDTPPAWLAAGQALASVLLWACTEGVTASYLNQPCEIEALRIRFRDAIGCTGFPQLVLRMGYGAEVPPTPRRRVTEVLEH